MVDLHTHSSVSDGSLSPGELVRAGLEAGLEAMALTDHDNVGGVAEALAAGRELGLEVVAGVEISALMPGRDSGMHVLGLFVDHGDDRLLAGLERLQNARRERNPKIARKLRGLGIDISMDEVLAAAGGGQVGRPHFAQVLVEKGVVSHWNEAFGRYLAAGAKAYVPKYRFSAEEAISLLRSAGAVPVLAHPGLLKLGSAALEGLVRGLKEMGLEGIEAYYSDHDTAATRALVSLAARLGLAVSGGSDFHGAPKPDIRLGRGRGGLNVPYGLLKALKARRPALSNH